ncbi:MAG: Cof-type HAD-IIB family hydrolase [Ferruginibacter sp.]
MKYKAIFIDVDGTLLTDELTISQGTKTILSKLHNAGMLISIVTARPPGASLPIYDQLGITGNPIICFNGALILKGNNILYEATIAASTTATIIEELQKFAVSTSLYHQHNWFTNHIDSWIEQEIEITGSRITEVNFTKLIQANFEPNKILCMGAPAAIEATEQHLKMIGFPNLGIHKSKPTYLEIMNNKASKSQGVEKVISAYQINKEDIIAIGDNFNDIDMLQYAGTSIAMGNAPDAVKKHATIVTESNNNEGIQKALNELIK